MNRSFHCATLTVLAIVTVSAGCGGKTDEGPPFVRKTPVTVAEATREPLQAVETTVGRLEATAMPALAQKPPGASSGCTWTAAASSSTPGARRARR